MAWIFIKCGLNFYLLLKILFIVFYTIYKDNHFSILIDRCVKHIMCYWSVKQIPNSHFCFDFCWTKRWTISPLIVVATWPLTWLSVVLRSLHPLTRRPSQTEVEGEGEQLFYRAKFVNYISCAYSYFNTISCLSLFTDGSELFFPGGQYPQSSPDGKVI